VGTGDGDTLPPRPTPEQLMSSNCFGLLFVLFLYIFINLYRRQLQPDVDWTNLTILWHLNMGPVLVILGKSHQTEPYTCCQWCVEGNVAGVGASNNGKWKNDGAVGYHRGPITYWTGQLFES
jgi:hypothetical protein